MTESESRRQVLYTGLSDVLGPDLTASLMSFLPFQPATELATEADIQSLSNKIDQSENRLSGRMDEIGGRIDELTGRVDHLSDRMDRLQPTLLGGFAAMIAALLATGFLA